MLVTYGLSFPISFRIALKSHISFLFISELFFTSQSKTFSALLTLTDLVKFCEGSATCSLLVSIIPLLAVKLWYNLIAIFNEWPRLDKRMWCRLVVSFLFFMKWRAKKRESKPPSLDTKVAIPQRILVHQFLWYSAVSKHFLT